MPLPRSTKSSARFARGALALVFVLAAGAGLRDERADACGYSAPAIEEITTFDPKVLGDPTWDGLYYDPFVPGFGGACTDCATKAMLADWRGYLKEAVTAADWEKVLLHATPADLAAIAEHLAGRGKPPAGFERSSLWKSAGAARDRLAAAVGLVSLARRVEPFASFEASDERGNPRRHKPPPTPLRAEALAGLTAAASDPFLAQRYAFQALRIHFYRRDWTGAISFFDKQGKALAGPSADLPWRARYYVAGALLRDQQRARANLELARVHAGYPPLAGAAAQDFQPMEEADWRATLRLARDAREQALLWRLVGVKQDGIVAIRELAKLDPRSSLIALLLVRELARAESMTTTSSHSSAVSQAAVQPKAFAVVEQLAAAQASTPGADRPWLAELVAAHAAARRGDVAAVRARLGRATAARPGDARVTAQARATLALALAVDWKINPAAEQELARAMSEIDPRFTRLSPVRSQVRAGLATAYAKAGQLAVAEFLQPGIAAGPAARGPSGKPAWQDSAFIQEMIAQTGRTQAPFERFLLDGSYDRPALERELALRYLVGGDFAAAAQTFKTTKAPSTKLGTDPFVIHIVDCHDCDHERYANAPWTHASFAARLAELERAAKGSGEPAAEAALALGNALYNITHYGNARVVLADTHQKTTDMHPAERWYRRAHDLSKSRELKAKAAYLASKAELAHLINAAGGPPDYGVSSTLPVPKLWFSTLKKYADTKYYREVLRECGHFSNWQRNRP